MLGLRTTPVADTPFSPAEMLFGQALHLPGQFPPTNNALPAPHHNFVRHLQQSTISAAPPAAIHSAAKPTPDILRQLQEATHAFLQHPNRKCLVPPYTGPHKITRISRSTVYLDVSGKPKKVAINRCKPAIMPV